MQSSFFFIGKWKGVGKVIEKPVQYFEEAQWSIFRTDPIYVINYQHQTWRDAEKTKPMHLENGIIKIFPKQEGQEGRRVEANYSHAFSLNNFEVGTLYDNNTLVLESSKPEQFQRGPSAKGKQTTGFKREYALDANGNLTYKMHLAVDGGPLYFHLENELTKE